MHTEDATPHVVVERVASIVTLHIGGLVQRTREHHAAVVAFEPIGSVRREIADAELRGALAVLDSLAGRVLGLENLYRAVFDDQSG